MGFAHDMTTHSHSRVITYWCFWCPLNNGSQPPGREWEPVQYWDAERTSTLTQYWYLNLAPVHNLVPCSGPVRVWNCVQYHVQYRLWPRFRILVLVKAAPWGPVCMLYCVQYHLWPRSRVLVPVKATSWGPVDTASGTAFWGSQTLDFTNSQLVTKWQGEDAKNIKK